MCKVCKQGKKKVEGIEKDGQLCIHDSRQANGPVEMGVCEVVGRIEKGRIGRVPPGVYRLRYELPVARESVR